MKTRNSLKAACLLFFVLLTIVSVTSLVQAASRVVVIPIRDPITSRLADTVCKSIDNANSSGAKAIILDINTPGGLVDAATKITDKVNSSRVPVIAFINKRAWSAGALIAISAPTIVIAPGGSIGAAEPRPMNEKTVSALRAEFESCAEKNRRRADIAGGMVDKNVVISGLKEKDTILSLTAQKAKEVGYADYIAKDYNELLAVVKMSDAKVEETEVQRDWIATLAHLCVNPWIATFLMTIGIIGIILEILTLNGVWGGIGLIALSVFFVSHIVVGITPWWVVLIFFVGIVLLALEIFVIPGWGITGISGIALTFISLFIAVGDIKQASISLLISILLSTAVIAYALKTLPKTKIWERLSLQTQQTSDKGYNSVDHRRELEGAVGVAISDLRPAGVAMINEERIDVTTDGEFIKKESHVRVVKVEGMRIVVKEAEGMW